MSQPTKYHLDPPAGLYSLNVETKVFPDFEPWEHKPIEDKILANSVTKGYFQPSKVSFETISGKSTIIQEPLNNLASRLSENFDELFKLREEKVNKIKNSCSSNSQTKSATTTSKFKLGLQSDNEQNSFFYNLSGEYFKLPKRVTLTDAKREQWLEDLTATDVEMGVLINSIPHGFKRKQLLEQLYLKQVPFSRAIWLIKYCYCVEWSVLSSRSADEHDYSAVVSKIYQEWTSAMVQILEKLVFEMPVGHNNHILNTSKRSTLQNNINKKHSRSNTKTSQYEDGAMSQQEYGLKTRSFSSSTLSPPFKVSSPGTNSKDSINSKMNQNNLFKNSSNPSSNAFGSTKTNFSNTNTADRNNQVEEAELLKWKINIKYFLKLLGNCYSLGLLDKYLFINWLVEFFSKMENFEFYPISLHILTSFWNDIIDNKNVDTFIIGKITDSLLHSYNTITHSKSMLNDENYLINDVKKNEKIKLIFLTTLKNLIIKIFHYKSLEVFVMVDDNKWDLYKECLKDILEIENPSTSNEIKKKFSLISYRNESLKKSFEVKSPISDEDFLMKIDEDQNLVLLKTDFALIDKLDNNKISDVWDDLLLNMDKDDIVQMILWAVSPNKKSHYEGIYLVAKLLILKLSYEEKFDFDMENIFWKVVFIFAKAQNVNDFVDFDQLQSLINMSILYGIVKVPTYIRKLISSGVLYLNSPNVKTFHCRLLVNLKIQPVIKFQFNMVLKNVDAEVPYSGFKYGELVNLAEELKLIFIKNENNTTLLDQTPVSAKIMVADWYLTDLMTASGSDQEEPVINKSTIKRVFQHLCVDLGQFHHFYRWVEFLVYQQQLSDISGMEGMIDILLAYQKLFALLINDCNLFMKSVINLYLNKLKQVDAESFQVIKFNKFWKFFLKHFENNLNSEASLRMQLNDLCEIENDRLREYSIANHHLGSLSNQLLNKNLKDLLNCQIEEELKQCRLSMLSIQIVAPQDYSKYLSFILKRKRMENENSECFLSELMVLVSHKLLSLDFVFQIFGIATVINILKYDTNDPYVIYMKKHYIKHHYEQILEWCVENNDIEYLVMLINHYGGSLARKSVSSKILKKMIIMRPELIFKFLRLSVDVTAPNSENYYSIFAKLSFSNLKIAQVFVECILLDDQFLLEEMGIISTKILNMMHYCHNNYLYAYLFDSIQNMDVLQNVLEVINISFLNDCFMKINDEFYLYCNKCTIMNLSKTLVGHDKLLISSVVFESYENLMQECFKLNLSDASAEAKIFYMFIEFLSIYQRQLFDYIVDSGNTTFVPLLSEFFKNKNELSLKTKLFIYDILHKLKSQYTYLTTLNPLKLDQIPKELIDLPPFHLSSFDVETLDKSNTHEKEMGIVYIDYQKAKDAIAHKFKKQDGFRLYNRKTGKYDDVIEIPEFIKLTNYNNDKNGDKLNNTFLNLSLFDSKLERKNIR